MRLRIFSCLLLLAVSFDAAANQYDAINRVRAGDGNCAVPRNLPPLRPQSALERVARDLARGDQLERSLQAAGYEGARSSTLSVRGDGVGSRGGLALLLLRAYGQALRGLPRVLRQRRIIQARRTASTREVITWLRRYGVGAKEIALLE